MDGGFPIYSFRGSIKNNQPIVLSIASSHYRIPGLCREPEALGKDELTLGKLFAESSSRQRAVGKTSTGKGFFAESPSRQNIYRE